MVTESGLAITFDAKTSEGYELSRDVAEAALETGYKIADGIVTNQPEISFEGIVTSVYQTGVVRASGVGFCRRCSRRGEYAGDMR
ncbi:TPA: phage baseplate protein [Citrobacter gillenii]